MRPGRVFGSVVRALTGVTLLAWTVGCGGGTGQRAGQGPEPESSAADCGRLSGVIERVECFADEATRAGHPRICQEAGDEGVRYQCIAILAGRLKDASLCDDIPASSDEARALRDVCLSDVAEVLEESALCGRILTSGLQDSCYLKVARKTGDGTLCDRIEDAGLKSSCTGEPVLVE